MRVWLRTLMVVCLSLWPKDSQVIVTPCSPAFNPNTSGIGCKQPPTFFFLYKKAMIATSTPLFLFFLFNLFLHLCGLSAHSSAVAALRFSDFLSHLPQSPPSLSFVWTDANVKFRVAWSRANHLAVHSLRSRRSLVLRTRSDLDQTLK